MTDYSFHAQVDTNEFFVVPTTGFNLTVPDNASAVVLKPAGLLATGTLNMAANPQDGQIVRISCSQVITLLVILANAGQSILNAITTIAAGGAVAYRFRASDTSWYRY